MSNGFVNRSKGKSSFQALWIAGSAQLGPTSAQSYSTAGTQPNGLAIGSIGTEKVSNVNASSALSIFTLGTPVPGLEKMLALAVSSGVFIKSGCTGGFDGSTNTVFKSTYSMQVELVGISSIAWRIVGVWPPPSTLVGGSGITLTTTT